MRLPRRTFPPAFLLAAVLAGSACGTPQPSGPPFADARGRVLSPADEAVDDFVVAYLPGGREALYAATITSGGGPPALIAVDLATGRRRILHSGLFGYSSVYALSGADGGADGGAVLFAAASVPDLMDPGGGVQTLAERWGYYRLPLGDPPGPLETLVPAGALGTEGTPMLGTDALSVALSPDSTHLGYVSGGQLVVYDLAARAARPLGPVAPDAQALIRFTADGAALLAPRPGDPYASLRTVSLADGRPGVLLAADKAAPTYPPERAVWETVGQGKRNAFDGTYRSYASTLTLADSAGGHMLARALTYLGGTRTGGSSTQTGISRVVVAPDGRGAVYLIEGRLYTNRLP